MSKITRFITATFYFFIIIFLCSCNTKPDLDTIKEQLYPFSSPRIQAIEPETIFTGGSTEITITGENFYSGNTVTLGGKPCLISNLRSNKITCKAPRQSAEGTYKIQINGYNSSQAVSAVSYDNLAFSSAETFIGRVNSGYDNFNEDDIDGYLTNGESKGAAQMFYENEILYSADYYGKKIKKINLTTGETKTVMATTDNPYCLFKVGATIYYCDGLYKISKTTSEGMTSATVVGSDDNDGFVDSASPSVARFTPITSIVAYNNYLYIFESNSHVIRKLDLTNPALSTVAGDNNFDEFQDGIGTAAHIRSIQSTLLIGTNVYFTDKDTYNVYLRKLNLATSEISTVAGFDLAYDDETVDGNGTLASLGKVVHLSEYNGNILFYEEANTGTVKIRTYNATTSAVSTLFQFTSDSSTTLGKFSSSFRPESQSINGIYFIPEWGLFLGNDSSLLRIY